MKMRTAFPSVMVRSFLVVAPVIGTALTTLVAAGPASDDVLPKTPPPSKYDLMASHSPFSPPTAGPAVQATPPPPPTPAWSDSLTIKGVMQTGDVFVAIVEDTNNPHHYAVRSDREEPESHLTLASVKWVNKADPPTVTVRRGASEFAQLRYEPTGAVNAPSAGGGPAIPGMARPVMPTGIVGGGAPAISAIRPPPGGNTGGLNLGAPNSPRGAVIRRPIIQATPAPAARSVLNHPVVGNPAAGKAGGDDDDDDD